MRRAALSFTGLCAWLVDRGGWALWGSPGLPLLLLTQPHWPASSSRPTDATIPEEELVKMTKSWTIVGQDLLKEVGESGCVLRRLAGLAPPGLAGWVGVKSGWQAG